MRKSIMQQGEPKCFLCNTTLNLEHHHCMHGSSWRKKADKYGLWVYLCHEHHTGSKLSAHQNDKIDRDLKAFAQSCFEEQRSHEEWMREFGRNYLR